ALPLQPPGPFGVTLKFLIPFALTSIQKAFGNPLITTKNPYYVFYDVIVIELRCANAVEVSFIHIVCWACCHDVNSIREEKAVAGDTVIVNRPFCDRRWAGVVHARSPQLFGQSSLSAAFLLPGFRAPTGPL